MYRRISETMVLEHTSTKVVASPIARLFATAFVTARAEQSPSVCTSTGFSCQSPRVRTALGVLGPDDCLTAMLMRGSSQDAGELRARQLRGERPTDVRFRETEERGGRRVGVHHGVGDDGETLHGRRARRRSGRIHEVMV